MSPCLIIDTAQTQLTIGLFSDHEPVAHFTTTLEKGHQEALGPYLMDVLREANMSPKDIKKIGVCVGPGSFTGLRVGLSYAQGLAAAGGAPLYGLSALEAFLCETFPTGSGGVIFDGGREHLYVQTIDDGIINKTSIVDYDDNAFLTIHDKHVSIIDKQSLVNGKSRLIINNSRPLFASPSLSSLMGLLGVNFSPYHCPSALGFYQALVKGHVYDPLKPLYFRGADAKLSQKPVLHL